MKNHRFKTVAKSGKKARRGGTKKIRVGSRNPGATRTGSIRHPF